MSERIPKLIRNRANGVTFPYDDRLMKWGNFDVVEYEPEAPAAGQDEPTANVQTDDSVPATAPELGDCSPTKPARRGRKHDQQAQ